MMAGIDWTGTALGETTGWPVSLITTMGIVLGSRKAMAAWWGPRLVQLYNDAYGSMLGDRHPGALGEPAQSTWRDVWWRVGDEAERVLAGQPSGCAEHVVVPAGRA